MSGFAPLVRAIIRDRSGNVCEVQVACDGARAVQIHHRRGRFMGGSKRPETNLPANALNCCLMCHHHISHNQAQGYEKGWLVSQSADPALIPAFYRGEWVKLDQLGQISEWSPV